MIADDRCPYCQERMESGRVMAGKGPIKWYPDDGNTILGLINLDARRVGEYGFLRRSKLIGFRCRKCDVIIVNE